VQVRFLAVQLQIMMRFELFSAEGADKGLDFVLQSPMPLQTHWASEQRSTVITAMRLLFSVIFYVFVVIAVLFRYF
jgi:hypothetical protein